MATKIQGVSNAGLRQHLVPLLELKERLDTYSSALQQKVSWVGYAIAYFVYQLIRLVFNWLRGYSPDRYNPDPAVEWFPHMMKPSGKISITGEPELVPKKVVPWHVIAVFAVITSFGYFLIRIL